MLAQRSVQHYHLSMPFSLLSFPPSYFFLLFTSFFIFLSPYAFIIPPPGPLFSVSCLCSSLFPSLDFPQCILFLHLFSLPFSLHLFLYSYLHITPLFISVSPFIQPSLFSYPSSLSLRISCLFLSYIVFSPPLLAFSSTHSVHRSLFHQFPPFPSLSSLLL